MPSIQLLSFKISITALEAEASIPAEKTNKLSEPDVLFCTYMLDKYGDDYKVRSWQYSH